MVLTWVLGLGTWCYLRLSDTVATWKIDQRSRGLQTAHGHQLPLYNQCSGLINTHTYKCQCTNVDRYTNTRIHICLKTRLYVCVRDCSDWQEWGQEIFIWLLRVRMSLGVLIHHRGPDWTMHSMCVLLWKCNSMSYLIWPPVSFSDDGTHQ